MTGKVLTDEDALYAAVGRALTTWAEVEDALGEIYSVALNPRNPYPAERAYWAITSFENRLRMTGNAVEHRGQGLPTLADWSAIGLALTSNNRTRNKIAHGAVIDVGRGGLLSKRRWVLAPYHHSRKRPELTARLRKTDMNRVESGEMPSPFIERPKEKYSLAQVNSFKRDFEALKKRLNEFYLVVERLVCLQEGVPLAKDPKDQRLTTILSTLPPTRSERPAES